MTVEVTSRDGMNPMAATFSPGGSPAASSSPTSMSAPATPPPENGKGSHEPFAELVTFVPKPRRFVIANDVYIPGNLIGDREVRKGDLARGIRIPSVSGRVAYRASSVDSFEPVASDERDGSDASSDIDGNSRWTLAQQP